MIFRGAAADDKECDQNQKDSAKLFYLHFHAGVLAD
jgi:hypothetical protein